MNMKYIFIKDFLLNEQREDKKLSQVKLKYGKGDLDPVISEDTMDYHYGKLYKTYVDRFNAQEGDPTFNEAGAYLHHVYFTQFASPIDNNNPDGTSLEFINEHFDSFENLKDEIEKEAMSIQGSGWVYVAKNGKIKTIKNHAMRSDIVLLIDWWEHAWALDYQADKAKYLKNIWKIIDWSVIDQRLIT